MATAELTASPREAEADRVRGWRLEELLRAGYNHRAALEVADRMDVDLHEAVDMVRAGCPVSIALRILL
jgi:hypothetical protein